MEVVTSAPVASPSLYQLTLSVLGTVDTWASDPAQLALSQLVEEAPDDEVALVPHSVGAILPLLVGQPDRLRVAFDAIIRFDLYEAAPGLSVLVWQNHPEAILAGAALARHPGAPESFHDLVGAHLSDLNDHWQQDLYLTRLRSDHEPDTDAARIDRQVRWLPQEASDSRFATVVVEPMSEHFPARSHLRLLIDFVTAGVVVRRLPTAEETDGRVPRWVPVVGPRSRLPALRVAGYPNASTRRRIVRLVRSFAPNAWRSTAPLAPQLPSPLSEVDDIDVFDDGSLPRREVAYLSGVRPHQLGSLKGYPSLIPLSFRGSNYWTFSQLVGLRTARYLFQLSGRNRNLLKVAADLVTLAREARQVPVAITKVGEVLVKDGDNLHNLETGQLVYEDVISMVDDVYEPFTLDGEQVPRLLRPSPHVSVHPGVVRGLPCVGETRVTVAAVASALSVARSARRSDPASFAAETFEISIEQVHDAERVSNAIRSVS